MKRVLLKLSGEALAGDKHHGFDEPTVTVVAKQVKKLVDSNGNIVKFNPESGLLEEVSYGEENRSI